MLEDLFESLELLGLTPKNSYNLISTIKNDKLSESIHILDNIIKSQNEELRVESSMFNFIANEDLSGGSNYCASLNCRLKKAYEMANFSALYADTILIMNPFEKYLSTNNFNDITKKNIANDIIVIWSYMPLITKGIVRFAQTEHFFCEDCFKKISINKYSDYEKKIENSYKFLQKEYIEKVDMYYVNEDNSNFIELKGPEELVEHGSMYIYFGKLPKQLKKYSYKKGKYKLDKDILKKTNLLNYLPDIIIQDFEFQDWYCKNFDFSYLTNREIDINLINHTNDIDMNEINRKIYDCISHQLPIMSNVDIKDILKIRENDGDVFKLYRDNVKKLIRELPNNSSQIKEAFSDVVQPEIDKINISLNESQKSILKNATKNIIITSGIIGIGLYAGILPNDIKELMIAAGGCGLVQAGLSSSTDFITKPNTLRENPYYFLWKVNKSIKK